MCKHCIVFGALINAGRKKFDGCVLSKYDYLEPDYNTGLGTEGSVEQDKLREMMQHRLDNTAANYLFDIMAQFKANSVHFIPLKVDSDGSCLTHAVSFSTMGQELFYDVLRDAIVTELSDNGTWYRVIGAYSCLDDAAFQVQILSDIESARPTKGRRSEIKVNLFLRT